MHPAPSLILFTTLSGAGYGLLGLLALAGLMGLVPAEPSLGFTGIGIALVMVTIGLCSSTLHLGHPERAWRAFSQWRSSWLSREGVLAVWGYLPALLLAWLWVRRGEVAAPVAAVTALTACVTVLCTAMIYASLKPVARWHTPWVPATYLAFALATGMLWLALLLELLTGPSPTAALVAGIAAVLAWALKLGYWHATDHPAVVPDTGSATGLGALGPVRLVEPPHTGENYLTREMGFRIARKHARKLRRIALVLGAGVPLLLGLVQLLIALPMLRIGLVLLAVLAGMVAVLIERWLFFAEAQHRVMLYYGRSFGSE